MRMLAFSTICTLLGVVFSSYSDDNIVTLEYELETCITNTANDISCMTSVLTGLNKMSKTIEEGKQAEDELSSLIDDMNELSSELDLAKYAPAIIGAVDVLRKSIKAIETPLTTTRKELTNINAKIYSWKSAVDSTIYTLDAAIINVHHINSNCTNGESFVSAAKSCVGNIDSGETKTSAQNGLKSFGGALYPSFNELNKALLHTQTLCEDIKPFTDLALNWPDLTVYRNPLRNIRSAIKPIKDFFSSLKDVLDKKICQKKSEGSSKPVDPLKRLLNRGKRSLTADETAELKMLLKKSLNDITTYEKSKTPDNAYKAKSDTCFSVRQVLNEVGEPYDSLVEDAVLLIDKLLPTLPDFTLPGLPSKPQDFNTKFNLPPLEFGIDFDLYARFDHLNFKCITDILRMCEASDGHLNVDCGLSLSEHQKLFGNNVLESLAQEAVSGTSNDKHKGGKNMLTSEAVESVKHMSSDEKNKLKEMLQEIGVEIPEPKKKIPVTTTKAPKISDKEIKEEIKRILDGVNLDGR